MRVISLHCIIVMSASRHYTCPTRVVAHVRACVPSKDRIGLIVARSPAAAPGTHSLQPNDARTSRH
jgi:hypothetical protein